MRSRLRQTTQLNRCVPYSFDEGSNQRHPMDGLFSDYLSGIHDHLYLATETRTSKLGRLRFPVLHDFGGCAMKAYASYVVS